MTRDDENRDANATFSPKQERARLPVPDWDWLKLSLEGQRIDLRPISASGKEKRADRGLRQLTTQILGRVPNLWTGLWTVMKKKEYDHVLLGAEFSPEKEYVPDDIATLLREFTEREEAPSEIYRWPSARLVIILRRRKSRRTGVEAPAADIPPFRDLISLPAPRDTPPVLHAPVQDCIQYDTQISPPAPDLASQQLATSLAAEASLPKSPEEASITQVPADLATITFTSTDPAVQRARTLLVRDPGEDLSDSAIRAQIDVAVEVLDSIVKGHSEFIPTIASSLSHLQAGLGERGSMARAEAPGGEKPSTKAKSNEPEMSAQETIKQLKGLREPEQIERFLERFVVGKTWGNLKDNQDLAYELSDHLRSLKLRFACPKDNEPSYLRAYATGGAPEGAFYFEHYTDKRQRSHGGTKSIPPLKVVSAPPNLRRKSRQPS